MDVCTFLYFRISRDRVLSCGCSVCACYRSFTLVLDYPVALLHSCAMPILHSYCAPYVHAACLGYVCVCGCYECVDVTFRCCAHHFTTAIFAILTAICFALRLRSVCVYYACMRQYSTHLLLLFIPHAYLMFSFDFASATTIVECEFITS